MRAGEHKNTGNHHLFFVVFPVTGVKNSYNHSYQGQTRNCTPQKSWLERGSGFRLKWSLFRDMLPSLKLTGEKINFLLGRPDGRCYVDFGECNFHNVECSSHICKDSLMLNCQHPRSKKNLGNTTWAAWSLFFGGVMFASYSHEKNTKRILSMKYWFLNRHPYNGL